MADPTSVAPMDPALDNSPVVTDSSEEESTVMLDNNSTGCVWNGQPFADGASVDSGGAVYVCDYGRWIKS